MLTVATGIAQASPHPKIWIFNGTPGDDEHHKLYEKTLTSQRKTFSTRFGIPPENVQIFYGPKSAGYAGIPIKETLLSELKKAAQSTQGPNAQPVWIIFQGHANQIPGGMMYNIPGPDVSHRDIGKALSGGGQDAPLVVIATTSSSGKLLRELRGPGRLVLTATSPNDPQNETELPWVFTEVIASPHTDANGDGLVSVLEIFKACHAGVKASYDKGNFMIKEHALLDGNGDGKGTARPADADAEPAAKIGLTLPTSGSGGFD
ncbi:hypothetical protein V2O64_09510 [Verrucomicrobiaceae bacterium 227]